MTGDSTEVVPDPMTGSGFAASAASSEGELVAGARQGEWAAWDSLVDRFGATVWDVARAHRLSAVDAEQVSAITWLRLAEHLDRIEPDRVEAWLATTAQRESLRVLRLTGR